MSNPTPEARAVALFSDIRHDDCCDDPGCQVSYIRFPDGQHIEIGTRDMHVERLDVLGANVAAAITAAVAAERERCASIVLNARLRSTMYAAQALDWRAAEQRIRDGAGAPHD
jgi:hypothetical protein